MKWSLALATLVAAGGCVPAERPPEKRHVASSRPSPLTDAPLLEPAAAGAGAVAPSDEAGQALPVLQVPFIDHFERASVGDDYFATGSQYRLDRGRLCVKGAKNHPLWLRHRLPKNARIEVEAETPSPDGDIKLEAWGDGRAAASTATYTNATSYLAIFGGWKNRYHVLARMDEHESGRPEIVIEPGSDDPRQLPVIPDRRYRLKLERTDGRTVRFWVDDVEMLSFTDPKPLTGSGHDHFAFNNWLTPVCFDNLRVEPLPG